MPEIITLLMICGVSESSDLLFLSHDVARLLRHEADRRASAYGMTRAQWALMSRLARNPGLSQKELADLLEVEPISVARMVDRLEANGMLERRADANDRRIWRDFCHCARTIKYFGPRGTTGPGKSNWYTRQ